MSKFGRRFFMAGGAAAAAVTTVGLPRVRAADGKPRRFVFVPTGNGYDAWITMNDATKAYIRDIRGSEVSPHQWWRGDYGEETSGEVYSLSGALTGAPGLRELERLGLLDRSMMVYGLSSAVSGAFHGSAHGFLSSTRTVGGQPGGQTIDSYLAEVSSVAGVGEGQAPIDAVRIGAGRNGFGEGVGYDLCASGKGSPLPVLTSPEAAWNAYTRPFLDASGVGEIELRERLLEVAAQDGALAAAEMTGRPAAQHASLATAADRQLANLGRLRELIADRFGTLDSRLPTVLPAADDVQGYKRFQTDVALGALISGLTNVAVLSMGAAGGWGFRYRLGEVTIADSTHGPLYHPFSGLSDDSAVADVQLQRRAELREAWTLELDSVAHLARGLADTPEPGGEGTMLDNTAIVFLPNNGAGHHGSARDWPTLVVGGENLGLKTGNRAVFYPPQKSNHANRRELYNLWATFGTTLAGGSPEAFTGFGDPNQRLAAGGLPDLLE